MDFRVNFKRVFAIGGVFLIAYLAFIYYINNEGESANKSPVKSDYTCQRKEPYKLEPEFERARSLRNQRREQWGDKMDYSWFNCINVVYKDLPEEEGLFYFDKNASIQNLTIYVDTGYKSSDDLLTSILLEHEFAHVGQFISQITTGKETPCFESEASAFYSQLLYMFKLNDEERNSINQKTTNLAQGGYDNKRMRSAVANLKELGSVANDSENYCDTKFNLNTNKEDWLDCWYSQTYSILLNYVKSDPYYQKQCN
jgi:hypothetical protein